ncbi:MAG: hypothetical protein N2689_16235 [Verrucomicrobiae bacterium]|nr:hypothetical protein [Verrucomicrobiae bacterium]
MWSSVTVIIRAGRLSLSSGVNGHRTSQMKPRELFSVAVKGVGLYFIVFGIFRLLQIVDIAFDLAWSEYRLENRERVQIVSYVIAAAIHFAIAAFFLKRGDWLVQIAYPDIEWPEDSKRDEKHDG